MRVAVDIRGGYAAAVAGRDSLGGNIRRWRRHAELTQGQIAPLLGVKQAAVSKIEQGVVAVDARRLPRLAKRLGCTVGDLFAENASDPEGVTRAVPVGNKDQVPTGGSDAPQARLLAAAEAERDRYRDALEQAADAANAIVDLIAAAQEDRATRKGSAGGSSTRRKVG